ncbi:MAG: histidine--tRNA ligase [Schleiferiaceae bacterium]|nr:histidine--tRNA ligase [Schleiferiaceae bacterium]
MKPRVAKGTRDFSAKEVAKRSYVMGLLRETFELFGYSPLETPSFENIETVMGKYGEEGDRLIFKILRSGDFMRHAAIPAEAKSSEIADKALRYDLTVPFARYVVQNAGQLVMPFKRYQMQPVWRADNPQKGRFREFYQCDADVVGSRSLWQEVELIHLYQQAFQALKLPVTIRVNNRKVLAGIAEVSGVGDRLVDFTVALDKLDKIGKEGVLSELAGKGFNSKELSGLEPAMQHFPDAVSALSFLRTWLAGSTVGMQGVEELNFVLNQSGNAPVAIDITLARGLNYYTGCIIEVTAKEVQLGSVGGGGRYDDLTGIFGLKDTSGVGISFGLDRIILCLEELGRLPENSGNVPVALVFTLSEEDAPDAYHWAFRLRKEGLRVEFYPEAAKLKKQFDYAEKRGIPFVLIVGESEREAGLAQLKNLASGEQEALCFNDIVARLATH